MLIRPASRRRTIRRGVHLVELAVVISIFFVFVLALVEFGRGMMVSSLVTNAARTGCRVGILPGKQNSDVTAAVDSIMQAQGLSGYTTTVQVNGASGNVSSAATDDTITVIVSVPVANTSWVPMSFISGNLSGRFSLPHE